MANVLVEEQYLTDIADKIREKSGSEATFKPSEMAEGVEEVYTLGETVGASPFRKYLSGTLTTLVDDSITSLASDSLIAGTKLTSISCASVRTINKMACYGLTLLNSVNFPVVTYIGDHAFYGCTALTSVTIPSITKLGSGVFIDCTNITELDLSKVTSVAQQPLAGTSITSLDMPALTTVPYYGLAGMKVLTSVNLPNVTNCSSVAGFANCSALPSITLPLATSLGGSFFMECTSLTYVDLPKCTKISATCFKNCTALSALILRDTSTIATLANTNALTTSGIASGTGYIYVPSALIEDYKVATNWTTYADQFRALEDYTVDGTVTGELDETKI